ncbi:hypothetical protein OK074_7288 [Actinobacteria bacterium OK074]|nr:hypothetical protein OK074_7288 [Actinobacteria bacterium OK074]
MTERGGADNTFSGGTNNGTAIQAQSVGVVNVYPQAPPPPEPPVLAHPWAEAVALPQLWSCLPEGRDDGRAREAATRVATALAALHDEAAAELTDTDPWWDPDFAPRFLVQTVQILGELTGAEGDFEPVELAVLALAPFLSQTLWARTAATCAAARPAELTYRGGDALRRSYEKFCGDGHDRLVRRAVLGLRDRPRAEPEIGWWLFHQWVDEGLRDTVNHREAYDTLTAALPLDDPFLRTALTSPRTEQLLHGLRLPLWEMCLPERLESHRKFRCGGNTPQPQQLRPKLLALLLAVARARALDIPALPDDLVENVGIPDPVDLESLRTTTVSEAAWSTEHHALVLEAARCGHVAVVEALTRHVHQTDELLRDVHRAAATDEELKLLRALPHRALAERVQVTEDDDGLGSGKPGKYGKFQVDPRRVQNLLMGDQLYRTPGLAIRELYQNALDACRYRRARTQYEESQGARGRSWEGRITFTQGVTEDGRPYLDCSDNGIGMSESDLTRVFVSAGTRFTDLTDVRNERARWEAAGIRMYPVSRFGIGVLSYFMIADEIEITTRKLRDDGETDPCHTVAVYGPNHLFRIVRSNRRPDAGTTVRLYLREGAPSCVDELTGLLGFAEFGTVARHGPREVVWRAGEFRLRGERLKSGDRGLRAWGRQVPGPPGEDGHPRVIWCERGGGILVDGILTRPRVETGILRKEGSRFRTTPKQTRESPQGAVVNLTGDLVPRLSIDRLEILDDISGTVEGLLCEAADELAATESELLDFAWIYSLAEANSKVADIVVEAVMRTRRTLRLPEGLPFRPAGTGLLLEDAQLLNWARGVGDPPGYKVPDHILLWRLLAHGQAERLVGLVPELAAAGPLLPALPSDSVLIRGVSGRPSAAVRLAQRMGRDLHHFARRAAQLRLAAPGAPCYPDADPAPLDLALLSLVPHLGATHAPLTARHFIEAHVRHETGIPEIARRLKRYGYDVSAAEGLPDRLTADDLALVTTYYDGRPGTGGVEGRWSVANPVPPGHVVRAAEATGLPAAEVCARLRGLGFTVPPVPGRPGAGDLRLLSRDFDSEPPWIGHGEAVPYAHLERAAREFGTDVAAVAAVLTSYGLHPETTATPALTAADRSLLGVDEDTGVMWTLPSPSIHSLLQRAGRLGMPPAAAVERMRELGMTTPFRLPAEKDRDALDEVLLNPALDHWDMNRLGRADLSVGEVLLAAHRARAHVTLVARRLAEYGCTVPDHDWAETDRHGHESLTLLSRGLHGQPPLLDPRSPVPLIHILAASHRLHIPLAETAARLRALGMTVPDVKDTIRAAMAKLPLREPVAPVAKEDPAP